MSNCVQWTDVYFKVNPTDSESSATGFRMLPISLDNSYYCHVYANYFNSFGVKNQVSSAVDQKRYAHFMLDTPPNIVADINGFTYGLDFSPTVTVVGIGFYAFLICIKRW